MLWGRALILTGSVFSAVCGIDRGWGIYGIIRLVTILAVYGCLQQTEENDKKICLYTVPYVGIGILLIGSIREGVSLLYSHCFGVNICLPLSSWIAKTGRFAGPFSYPNTMALFLVMGIAVAEQFSKRCKWIFQIILCIGVLWTGSRTAFVVMLVYLIIRKRKSHRLLYGMVGAIAAGTLAVFAGKNVPAMSRFLTISMGASTLQGRLLYWEDACRMIGKHPFGLGYMGYLYMQKMMQTGVYDVRFVHNEWLQFILDYGILAEIGVILCGIGFGGKRKEQPEDKDQRWGICKREVIIIILAYSFFDFHLQFWGILLWLLLLVGGVDTNCLEIKKHMKVPRYIIPAGVVIAGSLLAAERMGSFYAEKEEYGKALRWNPWSTEYRLESMLHAKDIDTADILADDVLACNEYIYAVYEIKSNAAAQKGDIQGFIDNRKKVLQLRKYHAEAYEDYFEILYSLYMEAYQSGNQKEMRQCAEAMVEIEDLLYAARSGTSVRAFRIKDIPQLQLKKAYRDVIDRLKEKKDV